MSEHVLDSSAVLALLLAEPGAAMVAATLPGALISTVNLAEILTKLAERGMPIAAALAAVEMIGIETIPYSVAQACRTAELRTSTRDLGLSLGDRACLALACERGLPAVTADHAWARFPGCNVKLIRGPETLSR
jgi:PIN domain nuclease of toxin-antitoxin system